jgi:hypothetical protein
MTIASLKKKIISKLSSSTDKSLLEAINKLLDLTTNEKPIE